VLSVYDSDSEGNLKAQPVLRRGEARRDKGQGRRRRSMKCTGGWWKRDRRERRDLKQEWEGEKVEMALETGTIRPGRPGQPTLEGRPPTVSLSLSHGKHGGQLGQLHFHFHFHHSITPPPRLSPVGLRARALS
jgi:hypothetical protein